LQSNLFPFRKEKVSGERLGAGLLPPINAFGSSRLWRWESKRSACPAKAGKHLATAKAGNSVLQAGCVLCDFGHWSFHPEQCRVCFFFCFARPPLFPQGENRKMFLTAENFYKNILGRQKSHPAIEAEWLRKIFLLLRSHVFLKLSAHGLQTLADGAVRLVAELVGNLFLLRLAFLAQGDQKAVNLRKGARKPLRSSMYASSLLSGEEKKSVQTATASGSFFCDLLQGSFKFFTNIIGIQRMRFVRFFTKQLSVLEV